jgi:hypothetical protein
MNITHVRVRKLISEPGFSNRAVEVEAAVSDGEDPSAVRRELDLWCDAELAGKTLASLRAELDELMWTIDRQRRLKTSLEVEVEQVRKEIARVGGILAAIKLKEQDTGQADLETAIADIGGER